MTQQPEALRLADALDRQYLHACEPAAAELRRLHEAHDWQYKMAGERLRRVEKLEAQRDALLEALRAFESCALPVSRNIDERGHSWTEAYLDQALPIARAAIKAVEETK